MGIRTELGTRDPPGCQHKLLPVLFMVQEQQALVALQLRQEGLEHSWVRHLQPLAGDAKQCQELLDLQQKWSRGQYAGVRPPSEA